MIQLFFVVITLVVLTSLVLCKQPSSDEFKVIHPEWVNNATLYEVNIRQFTHEGTFKAFEPHLSRLNELGVEIIWFMPIHPIGKLNRKGPLGSYYSVRDYLAVNPEFGTLEDFKQVVTKAHEFGMKVIIDWVANHTSHDAVLIKEHPDWYVYDSIGSVISPFDWSDVAKLDYNKKELREYIINAMKFWVKETGIDGFRCDVAAEVPVSFWNEAKKELDVIKPLFMLAEAEEPEMQKYAFDADYASKFHKIMNQIAIGKESVNGIEKYLLNNIATYPKNTIKLNFITNHDENSWNGTEFERMGKSFKTFAALSFVIPGLPLIYSGQEVGLNRRLKFFEKEEISWNDSLGLTPFYKKLVELKKTSSVLAAGEKGADIFRIKSSNDSCVFSFLRKNETEKLFSIFNLSNKNIKVTFEGDEYADLFKDFMSGETKTFVKGEEVNLKPWEFHIYLKK
ncbi:MAG: alpha-amylase [Bacteroidales bacterium]|nr:alpha-amylase [Bacteroidales bacterium]